MESKELPNGLLVSTDILNDDRLNINEKIVFSVMSNQNITNAKAKVMKLLDINTKDFTRIIAYLTYLGFFNEAKKQEVIKKEKEDINTEELLKELEIDLNFKPAVDMWLTYKKNRKQTYKDIDSISIAIKRLVRLSDGSPQKAIEVVEQAIGNNYSGIFELKTTKTRKLAQNEEQKQDEEYNFATQYNAR